MRSGIFFRYLLRQLTVMLVIVLLVLAALECVIGIIGELPAVGHAHYTFFVALKTVLMQLPMLVYDLFPVSLFLSVLLTLSVLGGRQEIVVMRAAGLSVFGFCSRLLSAALLLVIVVASIAEGFAPSLYHDATLLRSQAVHQNDAPIHRGGHWFHDKSYFVFVGSQPARHELTDLQWFLLDKDQVLQEAGNAKHARRSGGQWVVDQAELFRLEKGRIQKAMKNDYVLPMRLDLSQWQSDRKAAIGMTLWDLKSTIEARQASGSSYTRLAMAWWERLWSPIAALVLSLLAVPFSLGVMRRFKTGTRLVLGIMVGFAFYMINQLLAPFTVVLLWSPFWVNCVPMIVFALLGCYFLKRLG